MNYTFIPTADNILVKPLKRKWKTLKTPVPDIEKWRNEHEGDNPTMEDELESKIVKSKVLLEFQLAEVITMEPRLESVVNWKVGDIVVYDMKPAREFNLIKGTEIVRSFNVYGKWVEGADDTPKKDPNVNTSPGVLEQAKKEVVLLEATNEDDTVIEDEIKESELDYDDVIPVEKAIATEV